jgi:hypothetical protein
MEKVLHPHHEYKMVSTIENIDHAKGNLKLKAHSGELAIHFPPAVVRDLKVGQVITVYVGLPRRRKRRRHRNRGHQLGSSLFPRPHVNAGRRATGYCVLTDKPAELLKSLAGTLAKLQHW